MEAGSEPQVDIAAGTVEGSALHIAVDFADPYTAYATRLLFPLQQEDTL